MTWHWQLFFYGYIIVDLSKIMLIIYRSIVLPGAVVAVVKYWKMDGWRQRWRKESTDVATIWWTPHTPIKLLFLLNLVDERLVYAKCIQAKIVWIIEQMGLWSMNLAWKKEVGSSEIWVVNLIEWFIITGRKCLRVRSPCLMREENLSINYSNHINNKHLVEVNIGS